MTPLLQTRLTLLLSLMMLTRVTGAAELTLLYTNDIESVYEPIESYWRDDIEALGGLPNVSALVNEIRANEPTTIFVDAGDMFTGALSKATGGKVVFDIYNAMGYDAANLGNHEFEYGAEILHRVMQRAQFPVLNANIFYNQSNSLFAREYAILEVDGIKIGVIGLVGVDAFTNTIMRANRSGLYVKPPITVVQELIDFIRPDVDVLLLLTHQNRTAPMQTNKEADPEVQRGFDEDYELAGLVNGVDMIRLVRINTLFQHSEKYRHPRELPVTPSFRCLIHELNELKTRNPAFCL